jgi:hypothetical protein
VTPLNGAHESHLINVLKLKSDRDTEGNPADADAERLDKAGEIKGSGLTIGRGRGGQDNLTNVRIFKTMQKLSDAKHFRVNALKGGKSSFKHMISAPEFATLFDGIKRLNVFDNNQDRRVSGRI